MQLQRAPARQGGAEPEAGRQLQGCCTLACHRNHTNLRAHLCCCCPCRHAAAAALRLLLAHADCPAASGPGGGGAPAAQGGGALVGTAGDHWGQCHRCARHCCHAAARWEGGQGCSGPGSGGDHAVAAAGRGEGWAGCAHKWKRSGAADGRCTAPCCVGRRQQSAALGGGRAKEGCRGAGRSHEIALPFPINGAPPGSRARQTLERQLGCSAPRSGGCSDRLPANHQQPRGGRRESQAVLNVFGRRSGRRGAPGALLELVNNCCKLAGAPKPLLLPARPHSSLPPSSPPRACRSGGQRLPDPPRELVAAAAARQRLSSSGRRERRRRRRRSPHPDRAAHRQPRACFTRLDDI